MLNLGKIQTNLFAGIFGAMVSVPNSLSITKDYILPLLKGNLEKIPLGQTILFLLSTTIFIASVVWIKEIIYDIERTSRFMNQRQFDGFMLKTIVIGLLAFIVGLIINKILFN